MTEDRARGTTRLEWRGRYRFAGTDSRGAPVALDAESKEGAKIADLVPLSLAACLAYDVVNVVRKSRQRLASLTATIDAEQDRRAPYAFRRIEIRFEAAGRTLTQPVLDRAVRLARKGCSVLASLDPSLPVVVEAVVVDADPGNEPEPAPPPADLP
jgi:putative redox protein